MEPVEKVLRDSKMDKGAIHEVVLVGGSTRIPKMQVRPVVLEAGRSGGNLHLTHISSPFSVPMRETLHTNASYREMAGLSGSPGRFFFLCIKQTKNINLTNENKGLPLLSFV